MTTQEGSDAKKELAADKIVENYFFEPYVVYTIAEN
jgi:hypothetical protein